MKTIFFAVALSVATVAHGYEMEDFQRECAKDLGGTAQIDVHQAECRTPQGFLRIEKRPNGDIVQTISSGLADHLHQIEIAEASRQTMTWFTNLRPIQQ